jgi:nitrite reductase/ring-hydroxylating ferredoxin subunit
MTSDTQRITPLARGWRWLWSMGLAIPLIVGAALVMLVLITLSSNMYKAPKVLSAGHVSDYGVGEPTAFKDDDFWLVRLRGEEFVALYDRDPISGCSLVWGTDYELMGQQGWFRDSCTGSTYDLTGACFGGPCEIGLNKYDLRIESGGIVVDPRSGSRGTLRSENGDPVNPPQ